MTEHWSDEFTRIVGKPPGEQTILQDGSGSVVYETNIYIKHNTGSHEYDLILRTELEGYTFSMRVPRRTALAYVRGFVETSAEWNAEPVSGETR